jgi:hypothetical protein
MTVRGGGAAAESDRGNSNHGGDVCVLVFSSSQKPSEWEFFVPTRTDLGVKLLMH